jgi:hypothetical protein
MKTYEMAREAGLWPAVTDTFPKELQAFADLVRADEREACAKVCDDIATEDGWEGGYANGCAVAIRARGNT